MLCGRVEILTTVHVSFALQHLVQLLHALLAAPSTAEESLAALFCKCLRTRVPIYFWHTVNRGNACGGCEDARFTSHLVEKKAYC